MKRIPTVDVIVLQAVSSNLQARSMGLPDVISTSLNVVFCGINPGMQSAAVGLHFANRSNRFWRVLHLAGFTARQLEPEEARLLLEYGCGITSAVARPTVSATDLSRADYIAARPVFQRKIAKYRPRYVAFLGKSACSVFLNQRDLSWGLQPTTLGESAVWVLPNPSGLNCAFTIGMLTGAYRELFEAVTLRGR
ncbi:MAG: G/U mismatch-specific DNA glycosylase [Terracidiphilus sp.]|jgi:TDG/mug DNA glycosylase family protein